MAEIKDNEQDAGVAIDTVIHHPKSYQVFMYNDDYTSQDFVVKVLIEIFRKSQPEAIVLMLKIHNEGHALVGIYSYDIAVSKVKKTTILARKEGFPLRCSIEEV